jgi:hypothetical protein
MRCRYGEVPCPVSGEFVCFRCVNCKKQVGLGASMRNKFEQITAALPECAANVDLGADAVAEMVRLATTAPSTPIPPELPAQPITDWDPAGAGTQLKKLLAKVGIKSTENCSCNARARIMNERGIEWCEQNVAEIIGWLKEEAKNRHLPFMALPTKILVQRAIKMAKRQRDKRAAS